MEKLKEFIEKKKEKSASRKLRYGTRKLSVGLVSCVLGYCIFLPPTVVNAQVADGEVSESTQISETREVSETSKASDTEAVESSKVESPAKEIASETSSREVTEVAEKTETPVKEVAEVEEKEVAEVSEDVVEEKEALPALEEKAVEETETADQAMSREEASEEITEEEVAEEAIENKEVSVEETEEAKIEEEKEEVDPLKEELANEEELQVSEEDPEALAASEETEAGRDISNEITEAEVHVGDTETPGTLNAGDGEGLAWSVAFKAPEGTKSGDYFDIVLSDNWTLKGIEPDTDKADPIDINGKTVADGKRLSRHKIRYTFNENVEGLDEVRVAVQYGGYDVKEKVQNSKTQTFTVSVGNHSDSKELFVNYGEVRYDDYQMVLNGTSQYTYFNPETGDFTQVFYINPESKYIGHSTGENFNGSVGIIVDNRGFDNQASQAYFTDENTSVEIVEVPQGTKIPDAVYENPVKGQTAQGINPVYDNGKIYMDFGKNEINNPYIITVKSKIDPNVKKINLGSRATLYGQGTLDLGLENQIQFETGNTGGSGVEENYSLGDRVWIDDNKDGIQTEGEKGVEGVTVKLTGGDLTEAKTTKTDADGNYKFEGLKNGEYTVTFEVPEGYEITKTDEGTDDEKDSDGKEVKATIKDADNMSVDLGLVKKEAPVEETYALGDRVWIDDNKDGIQGEKETGKSGVTVKLTGGDLTEEKTTTTDENGNYKFEGLKNGEYKVTFEVPEGYEITKTDEGTDDEKDSDGKEVSVTIKDEDNMSVDLGLVKQEAPEEKTYGLGDKVWIDEDKDGIQGEKETGKSGVTVKLTGGDLTEEKTTTTDENGNYKFEGLKNGEYKVTFEVPEGYEITKTDEGTDDEKDSDGKEVTVTIKDEDNMSVDLGLVKKDTPVDPSEPSEPEEPKDTTPLVPLTPAEEIEVERITHHDHKTPGTPVVTEVPSTPVVETEKTLEEKTEETTEVENKEEKVEEVKEVEEVKPVEGEDEVVEKVETNEVDKNLAPVSTNDDTKAPKTGDAGILSSAGLASLAASGLAYLELKKRNKKNK
ncbi:SdrD B-like domain-containing protein [Peptoniphilus timonensis]|uniref:SdrD B-like domain-containing protein n=1 Tax=Peptoniphilus timonensis TaxID=1268254 RepID=UPI00059474D6|nr:SdrD B-like domain-containing protein [Peptoniphilus timonensis]